VAILESNATDLGSAYRSGKSVLEIVMSLPGQTLRKIGLDGNPLRRTSDRVEAWFTVLLLLALVLVMPYAAWRAGRASYSAGVRTERVEQGHRYRTEAVLLPNPDTAGAPATNPGNAPAANPGGEPGRAAGDDSDQPVGTDPDAAAPAGRGSAGYSRVRAYARWTGADGTEHHGYVSVAAPAQPGTRVPVWTNAAGDLIGPPQRRAETIIDAATVAALTAAIVTGLLAAVRVVLRRALDAHRLARWQEAWWQYEPRWTGRRW
jgi:hypothetical protein